jgi:hypothetical protein
MRYVKWTFRITLALLVFAFLHYNLPQRDVVRIVDTYEKRIDFGVNSIFWATPDTGNQANPVNRDVFFIQTIRPDGKPMIYRNEDTGWGWPPYFKLDSANLQAEAANLRSDAENPQWVVVTHYGWRNEFLSIYPNAVAVRPVDSPDVRLFPWLNIVILSVLAVLAFLLWRMWVQFRERVIDPFLLEVEEAADTATARARGLKQRLARWLASWRGRR